LHAADRDMLAQLQPSIDTVANVPPGLTDLSTEACLLQHHFTWLSVMPTLRRLQTVVSPGSMCVLWPNMLAALCELRLTLDHSSCYWHQLSDCTQLRKLWLSSHQTASDPSSRLDVKSISALLCASAATLETIILGDLLLDGGSWAELAQCKQLRSLSLTLQPLAWETLLGALSQLPWFHTLELVVDKSSIAALPSGLLRHMTARADSHWRTVQLQLLHPRSSMDLVDSLEVVCPPAEAASKEEALQVRFIVSKQGKPRRTYVITVDEHGQRTWQKM
jgi:hypothetical protein